MDMVYAEVLFPNSFPAKDGIYNTIRPQYMLMGMKLYFFFHRLLEFGECFYTHEYRKKSVESSKLEALALRPTGKSQGGHYFLNLHTIYLIKIYKWTELPIPTRIKNMAIRMARWYPIEFDITERKGNYIIYDNPTENGYSEYGPAGGDSNTSNPAPITPDDYRIDDKSNSGIENGHDSITINYSIVYYHGPTTGMETNQDYQHNNQNPKPEPPEPLEPPAVDPETPEADPEADADNYNNGRNNYGPEYVTIQQYPVHKGYQIRTQNKKYLPLQQCAMQEHCPTAKLSITQYNTKKVLNKFGDKSDAATDKEVRQLLTMNSIVLDGPNNLMKKYQWASLG